MANNDENNQNDETKSKTKKLKVKTNLKGGAGVAAELTAEALDGDLAAHCGEGCAGEDDFLP